MLFFSSSFKQILILLACISVYGCTTLPEPAPSPTDFISANIKILKNNTSVVIIPMPPAKDFNSVDNLIHNKIANVLKSASIKTSLLDKKSYDELWNEQVNKTGGIFNQATGKRSESAYLEALSGLAKTICEEAKCNMVIIPNIIIKTAKLKGSYAEWDSTRQAIRIKNPNHSDIRMKGSISALSLEIIAVAKNGELAFKKTIGLTLPFETNIKHVQSNLREEVFSDDNEISYAVNTALKEIIK